MALDWWTLLHDYPDRFLVGLDLFAPAQYQPAYVNQMVAYYRALLGLLDPAAERIARFGATDVEPRTSTSSQ